MAGRPYLQVDEENIIYFKSLGYTQAESADLLGISYRTFKRILQTQRLRDCDLRTDLSDNQLDDLLREIVTENPNWGQILISVKLITSRIKVTFRKLLKLIFVYKIKIIKGNKRSYSGEHS